MFKPIASFSGFSVDDMAKAKKFYAEVLGLELADEAGGTRIHLPSGSQAWMYPKTDH